MEQSDVSIGKQAVVDETSALNHQKCQDRRVAGTSRRLLRGLARTDRLNQCVGRLAFGQLERGRGNGLSGGDCALHSQSECRQRRVNDADGPRLRRIGLHRHGVDMRVAGQHVVDVARDLGARRTVGHGIVGGQAREDDFVDLQLLQQVRVQRGGLVLEAEPGIPEVQPEGEE